MIQLEKMVKNSPTEGLRISISLKKSVLSRSYKFFMDKDTRDVSDILDHIEKATGEECLVAFGTLVAWEHINEGLIKRVKDMGKLDKLLRRIIETYENSDQEQKEYKMHIQVYNYTNNPARAPHLQRK